MNGENHSIRRALGYLAVSWLVSFGFLAHAEPEQQPISFYNEVVPVLTKAGCNMGACHGAQTGKGELNLSLRAENPLQDYHTLKKWLNTREPAKGVLLRKPTLQIQHEGGMRFPMESEAYETLISWMRQGAPLDPEDHPTLTSIEVSPAEEVLFEPATQAQLRVTAQWSDGTKRDVTDWAIYEPSNLIVEVSEHGHVTRLKPGETTITVRYLSKQKPARLMFVPAHKDFAWANLEPANFVDNHIFAKLKLVRTNPSELSDDATFVRRVYLDLLGLIPTADEARSFVASRDPDKRAKLVDALLERPEFADYWALKWADLLRIEEKVLDTKGVDAFHQYVRQSIAENRPLDQFIREILTGRGSTYRNGAANYYRALRNPASRAEAVAQVVLGTRLGCAKCHNHPYEHWTMDDYYQFAAVFDGIDYRIIENKRRDKNDRNQFIGEQVVLVNLPRSFKDPRSNQLPAQRLLGNGAPPIDDERARFDIMADWFTSAENPLFARVQINRIWYHLMGRGLVDPVDDLRATNPASHPELLEALASRFAEDGFDLRHAIRLITSSQTYQLSSQPNANNADDTLNYSHTMIRRLSAEPLLDSLHLAMDVPGRFNGFDSTMRATQLPGINKVYRDSNPSFGDRFLKLFGKPPRLTNSDMERSDETSLAQVFELVSGETLEVLLSQPDNRIGKLLQAKASDSSIIQELYWSILSRPPSQSELETLLDHVSTASSQRAGFEDIAWSLLNSKEFLLRR